MRHAGQDGFGYDPIFFFPAFGKTFAEISREEKNQHSHRGKAFRKALEFLVSARLNCVSPGLVFLAC